jgi:hypothetical protein
MHKSRSKGAGLRAFRSGAFFLAWLPCFSPVSNSSRCLFVDRYTGPVSKRPKSVPEVGEAERNAKVRAHAQPHCVGDRSFHDCCVFAMRATDSCSWMLL